MKNMRTFLIVVAAVFLAFVCDNTFANDTPQPFRDISASELVANITIGWNLGNTLDTFGLSWPRRNPPIANFERAWGNPLTTKANIDAIKRAGFNTIRIPVSWAKCADSNYNIRADWMARVKEVVDYAVDNDMYIVLNTHHDEDIFKFRSNEMEASRRAVRIIWEQIAETFKNYNEKLIFEAFNEPRTRGSPSEWSGGTLEERDNLNALYQLFVDTIRASGGNNGKRVLMVNTYSASWMEAAMNGLVLPVDSANTVNKLIASIHAYEPYNFALNENSTVRTWNAARADDTIIITEFIDRAYNLFVSKGIPVVIGEFAALNKDNTTARAAWAEYYVSYARSKSIPCIWWDDGGDFRIFDRRSNNFYFPAIRDALLRGAGVL